MTFGWENIGIFFSDQKLIFFNCLIEMSRSDDVFIAIINFRQSISLSIVFNEENLPELHAQHFSFESKWL